MIVIGQKNKKEMEEKLEQYREGVEASSDSIYMIDKDCCYVFANEEHLSRLVEDGRIPRKDEDLVVGGKYRDIHPTKDSELLEENVEKVIETGRTRKAEHEFSGTDRWSSRTYSPVEDSESGDIEGVVVVSKDITEKKKTEEKLRKSEHEKSLLLESTDEPIAYHDTEHSLVWMNQAYAEAVGESLEDLKGQKCYEIWLDREEHCEGCPVDRALKSGESEREEMSPPGEEGVWLVRGSPVRNDEGKIKGVIEVASEITERKEVEEELKRSKNYYETIIETSPEAIVITDLEGKIIDCNQKTVEMQGLDSKDELIGRDAFELISSEEREKAEENLMKTLESGEVKSIEYTIGLEGNEFPAEMSVSVIRDSEGDPSSFMAIIRDVTKRKKAEERTKFLHSLLRHDVGNKAQIVEGYLELLQDYDLPQEAEDFVKRAEEGIENAMNLIEKVRTLRDIRNEKETEEINVGSMIKNLVKDKESQAQSKGIEIECEEISCKVLGSLLLEELFSNIMENSIHHSGGSKIRVTSQEKNDECIIIVEDDGKGILDERKDKIFEKGFKDEETGGTGLGLHLVKEIAESSRGNIEVKDSELGGARFDVTLKKI